MTPEAAPIGPSMTRQSMPYSVTPPSAPLWPRGVNRRDEARAWWSADHPAIDKIGTGRREDLADALCGLRADRIAIDIDRLAVERRKDGAKRRPRASAWSGGRIDRKIDAREQRAFVSRGDMPAAWARLALAALRPESKVRTSAPLSPNRRPTPAPIVPCAITPMTAITYLSAITDRGQLIGAGDGWKRLGRALAGAPP